MVMIQKVRQYDTEIKKCEYALKLLSQFPNIKSLSDYYEKKYLSNHKHELSSKYSNIYYNDDESHLKDDNDKDSNIQ